MNREILQEIANHLHKSFQNHIGCEGFIIEGDFVVALCSDKTYEKSIANVLWSMNIEGLYEIRRVSK